MNTASRARVQRAVQAWTAGAGLLLVCACGPSLAYRAEPTLGWAVSSRCAQGPFVIEGNALGMRWGERWTVTVAAPRRLAGKLAFDVGEQRIGSGPWHTQMPRPPGSAWQPFPGPENAHCLARPAPVIVVRGPPPARPLPPAPPPPLTPPTLVVPPLASLPAPPRGELALRWEAMPAEPLPPLPVEPAHVHVEPPLPDGRPPRLQSVPAAGGGDHVAVLAHWSVHNDDPDAPAPTAKGTPLRLLVWSDEPNDWEGAVFTVEQQGAAPDVAEAEWIAHMRVRQAQDAAAARERAAAWQAEQAQRKAHCDADHDDEECWGPGGYAGAQRRIAEAAHAARTAKPARPPAATPAPIPGPVAIPQPSGPPPAARDDALPPRPSPRASWVTGWWRWEAGAWVWLSGWWQVPDDDRRADVAVVAPRPPPVPRVETPPPPPCPGAVWMAGHWALHLGAWVWAAGAWTLPPQPGARWSAARWVPVAGLAVVGLPVRGRVLFELAPIGAPNHRTRRT